MNVFDYWNTKSIWYSFWNIHPATGATQTFDVLYQQKKMYDIIYSVRANNSVVQQHQQQQLKIKSISTDNNTCNALCNIIDRNGRTHQQIWKLIFCSMECLDLVSACWTVTQSRYAYLQIKMFQEIGQKKTSKTTLPLVENLPSTTKDIINKWLWFATNKLNAHRSVRTDLIENGEKKCRTVTSYYPIFTHAFFVIFFFLSSPI